MSSTASLTVINGAERGQIFVLNGEVAHIGRSAENQLVLSDPDIAEHQACIANRNGRFAIYVSGESSLQLNGQPLPAEQWIWLPAQAALKFSERTAVQFATGATAEMPVANDSPGTSLISKKSDRKRAAKKDTPSKRVVAKFITDQTGETLVKLGEDGQLPELSLAEGGKPAKARGTADAKGNPALVYVALGFSVLASILLIVWEPTTASVTGKQAARTAILREFVGEEGKPLKPYQKLLREAQLAHARGDRQKERAAFQSVLKLLNSEDCNPHTGVTGHVEDDERLRKMIAALMGS